MEPNSDDETAISKKVHEQFTEGNFNRVPLLLGVNSNEAAIGSGCKLYAISHLLETVFSLIWTKNYYNNHS